MIPIVDPLEEFMAVEPEASEIDSVSCLLLGLFADQSTTHLFYTADKEVLLDVIFRRLTDYGPGDQVNTSLHSPFLHSIHRIVNKIKLLNFSQPSSHLRVVILIFSL